MEDNYTSNHQKMFYDLSEVEQEILVAGQSFPFIGVIGKADFFFQKTDLESAADNDLHLGSSEHTSQSSKYKLSQITIGTSFTFGLPQFNYGRDQWSNFLPAIFNSLFSK